MLKKRNYIIAAVIFFFLFNIDPAMAAPAIDLQISNSDNPEK